MAYNFGGDTAKQNTYNAIVAGRHKVRTQLTINGRTYSTGEWLELSSDAVLCDNYEIGDCITKEAKVTVKKISGVTLAKGQTLVIKTRVETESTPITYSDWIPKGTYTIKSLKENDAKTLYEIDAFDATYDTDVTFMKRGTWTSQTAKTVVTAICSTIGITLNSATNTLLTNTIKNIDYIPVIGDNGTTIRGMLKEIAKLYGGNWWINFSNELELDVLTAVHDTVTVGSNSVKSPTYTAYPAIDRVIVYQGDQAFYAPSGLTDAQWDAMTGFVLSVSSEYATQALATGLLTQFTGKVYYPYRAESARLPQIAELGDNVSINGSTFPLFSIKTKYGASIANSDIEAPNQSNEDTGSAGTYTEEQDFQRRVNATTKASIKTEIDGITMDVENNTGGYSKITLKDRQGIVIDTSDNITLGGDVFFTNTIRSKLQNNFGISYTEIGQSFIKSPIIYSADDISTANISAKGFNFGIFQEIQDETVTKNIIGIGYDQVGQTLYPVIIMGAGVDEQGTNRAVLKKFGSFTDTTDQTTYGNSIYLGSSDVLGSSTPLVSGADGFLADFDNGGIYKIVNGYISEIGSGTFG